MINAEKARMISEKRGIKILARNKKREIRIIKQSIKETAKDGHYAIFYGGFLYDETKEWLEKLGYSVDNVLCGDTRISWKGNK